MSEENLEEEKAKSPILKIILIVVGIQLLVVITVGETLFATGFLDANEGLAEEEAIAALEAEAAAQAQRPIRPHPKVYLR